MRHLSPLSPRAVCPSGRSRVAPANRIRLPSGSPTLAIFTRVAAQASDSVPSTAAPATIAIGLAPRPLA